jgi:uncharacterized protein YbjT (DUF2867 family)
MSADTRKVIAVIGATGLQGGSVVRALQADGTFRVRALTRHPEKHPGLADEVIEADMTRPETLSGALDGAYGVFVVTNFWEPGGIDEVAQAQAVIEAAKKAGVQHFVWSTLSNVEVISGGKFHVPHFTDKAKVDELVKAAGFPHYTFVVAPFFYQNLLTSLAPQPQQDGSTGWTLPIDPDARVVHMGDITELGPIVVGALRQPNLAGRGQYLPLVGDLLSFGDVVSTLNRLGHAYTFTQVPANVFATFFPSAGEFAEMFGYFERHTYLGAKSEDQIALARTVAGSVPTDFAHWARANMLAKVA